MTPDKLPPQFFDLSQRGQKAAMQARAMQLIRALPDKGVYTVEVHRRRMPKTEAQLGYYFGHIVPMYAEYTGYSRDEAAYWLAYNCDPIEVHNPATGEVLRLPRPLSTGDRIDLMERIDKARAWLLAECNIVTQDPDPNWRTRDADEPNT